ncbi:MAG: FG-GAP repeat protein, partial [Pseudomonadota bacterium]
PNVAGAAETDDHFGWALAAGDFNGDGYDDLAIGIPDEDIDTVVDSGGVQVMYGTASGLTAAEDKVWNQEGGAETGDQYGKALASGDFDNDGYDDLAVGIPSEDLGSVLNAGAVEIYYGSTSGLTTRLSNDFWHQDRSGILGAANEHDFFGSALTVGDFDGDSYTDLAVGVPYEDVGTPAVSNAGAVNILYGSVDGITSSDNDYWHQDSAGVGSLAEDEDRFGFALTAGDFDGDSYADLAVGIPYEHWNDPDTGIVQVLYGSSGGISAAGDQIWRQDIEDIDGTEEADDRFGYAVTAGDFNGDDYADLAIGVPYESISGEDQAGAVQTIYGSSSGLTASGDQLWYQGGNGLQGTAEVGDRFGYALAAIRTEKQDFYVYLPLLLKDE